MNELYDIDDLIAKVLTDEATADERLQLRGWLDDTPENRQYFDELKQIWADSETAAETLDVDTDVAWTKVQTRIQSTPKPLKVSWLSRNWLSMAAAMLLLIVASMWIFKQSTETITPSVIAAGTTEKRETLSDGTTTDLKPSSTLTTVFSKKERRVKLEGEAYFKVAPDKEKPFVIEVKTMEIKVVGTAFSVDNLSQKDKVIIIVTEGVVQVSGGNEEHRLEKDWKAVFDIPSQKFTVTEPSKQVEIMPSLNYEIRRKPLKEVLKDLEKYFKVTIEITSPNVGTCLVNEDFTDKNIELILDVVTEFCECTYEKTGKGYVIK